jgi:hypothetical protein
MLCSARVSAVISCNHIRTLSLWNQIYSCWLC